ncbi:FecR family protein [Bacteroidia bacterium]|nr:FecR family protein [Bacteroidia bacterium]MDC1395058.1 FecR family protein [Bacteroidia bacterium]
MNKSQEDILVKYISGNLSEKEKKLFEKELSLSDELTAEYNSFKQVWQLTNQLKYANDASNASWHFFQQEVKAPFKILGFDWLKVAASITILAAFSVGMWFFGSTDINLTTQNEKQILELVDNSGVTLNKHSTLTYDKSFGKKDRIVTLEGQAFFDVTKSEKQFVVQTQNGNIRVHGTEFNLYTDNKFLLVELLEGSISYQCKEEQTKLVPGERLVYQDGVISISTFKKESTWGELISCNDAPLAYVLGQLKLAYGINFTVSSRLLREHYTVTLPTKNITECISILNKVSGKSFALIDNTIVLK